MFEKILPVITAPEGFKAAGVKAGIKKSGKEDVAILFSTVPAKAAGVFTMNQMAAAPVVVCREVLKTGTAQAIVVNSGCANACTGEQGLLDAKKMAAITAELLNIKENAVFVSSTGIIGTNLPMDKVAGGIRQAVKHLSDNGHDKAMRAMMTTDTFAKETALSFTLGDKTIKIAGMAKGAGMIQPNMATMLAYITTDADIEQSLLQQALQTATELSFNMISVDGDTSTNDSVIVLANGLAHNSTIRDKTGPEFKIFSAALQEVCTYLAKQIAHDGEGATKFLEVQVHGAQSFADAKQVAMSIAKSPLVKTAFFGQDPNWGRIICAIGYAGVPVKPEQIALAIGNISIVKGGMGTQADWTALKKVMAGHDIVLQVELGLGTAEATVWTCDFSYEYVKINGEYHT